MVFWALTLYDLHVPKERYEEEISRAKDVITVLENNQEMVSNGSYINVFLVYDDNYLYKYM